MASSSTVIAALKFKDGVVIAADSQASDPVATVRWPVEKLDRIGTHPCVLGFSGSIAQAQKARERLETAKLHPNMFDKPSRVRDEIARCLSLIYKQIKQANAGVEREIFRTSLWGLLAYWAHGTPHILELSLNGDCEFHEHFHTIGSGANTAYAIYRTLGEKRLCTVDERWAIPVILRILRTCVSIEIWGVSEPLSVWVVSGRTAREVSLDEIQAHLQTVGEWEESERSAFFDKIIKS